MFQRDMPNMMRQRKHQEWGYISLQDNLYTLSRLKDYMYQDHTYGSCFLNQLGKSSLRGISTCLQRLVLKGLCFQCIIYFHQRRQGGQGSIDLRYTQCSLQKSQCSIGQQRSMCSLLH